MLTKSGRTLALVCAVVASTALCGAVSAADWNQRYDIGAISSENYDFELGPNTAHVVYEHDGNVYYAKATASDTTWDTHLIGAGSTPSIAVNDSGVVYVAYVNGSDIMEASSAGGWTPAAVGTGYFASISIDGSGTRHALVETNIDGDSYRELLHLTNSGSGWGNQEVMFDGWYDSDGRCGSYYGQSALTAVGSGYAYALESQGWGGRADWSAKCPSATIPGGPSVSTEVGWNTGSQITRDAISSGNAGVGFVFSTSGYVFGSIYSSGAWSTLVNMGVGGQASVATENGLTAAYQSGGNLMFFDGTAAEGITMGGVAVGGYNPILKNGGEDSFILFRDGQGMLSLITDSAPGNGEVTPEPGSLVMFGCGAVSLLGFIRRRMNR